MHSLPWTWFLVLHNSTNYYFVFFRGSAIAKIVGANAKRLPNFEDRVTMYVYEEIINGKKLTEIINETHENVKYLPGQKLPENVVSFSFHLFTSLQLFSMQFLICWITLFAFVFKMIKKKKRWNNLSFRMCILYISIRFIFVTFIVLYKVAYRRYKRR